MVSGLKCCKAKCKVFERVDTYYWLAQIEDRSSLFILSIRNVGQLYSEFAAASDITPVPLVRRKHTKPKGSGSFVIASLH